jgi:hypothetical protein
MIALRGILARLCLNNEENAKKITPLFWPNLTNFSIFPRHSNCFRTNLSFEIGKDATKIVNSPGTMDLSAKSNEFT